MVEKSGLALQSKMDRGEEGERGEGISSRWIAEDV